MALRPMSPSYAQWRANLEHYVQGCRRSTRLWNERGWEIRTGWESKEVSPPQNVELSSPQGQQRHTIDACTGRNPQSTEASFRSFIRSTNLRCTMWAFRGQLSNAPVPYPATRIPTAFGMACACTLADSTEGIGSGFWRNTPTPSPSVSIAGAKSQLGD